jgi:myo-inositol-1(or 4)-monophosphatase
MPASALMTIMVNAARKAGRSLSRDFGEVENLQISLKGPGNFVTAADHRAESILFEELSKARHGYSFLMEERGLVEGPDKTHTWIIDPLDGTTNFLHGIPMFAVSIALERDGDLVAGLIYNPITGDIYAAERGKGAYLNDRTRLRVAARSNMDTAVLATGIPHKGRPGHELHLKELSLIMRDAAGIRRMGSAALDLAYVAAGRFDGYWERGIHAWDMAAGVILVREAGGYVTDMNGKADMLKNGTIAAGNESIHRDILKKLAHLVERI